MRRFLVHEKFRFVLVGIVNTALDFSLLNIFVLFFGLPTIVANSASVSICIIISYFLNHHFVFQHESKANFRSFALFLCITGFSSIAIQGLVIWTVEMITNSSLGRSLIIVKTLADHTGLQLNFAKASAVGLGMIWNFVLYKYVVFKQSEIQTDDIT